MICQKQGEYHHIKQRGYGGTDDWFNLICLCREHHSNLHAMGNSGLMLRDILWDIRRERMTNLQKWVYDNYGWEVSNEEIANYASRYEQTVLRAGTI